VVNLNAPVVARVQAERPAIEVRGLSLTFTTADGRWRLPVALGDVDPSFIAMLKGYEDRRFAEDIAAVKALIAEGAFLRFVPSLLPSAAD